MTDHPSTFRAEDTHREGIQWDDRASIHRAGDDGVLYGATALHRGTLAEMVTQFMNYPEAERGGYGIQKAGDHRLGHGEIEALAARPDYPHN